LRETVATLRVYGAVIQRSPDPAAAAGAEVQEAHVLQSVLPAWATPPARLAALDGMLATEPTEYARTGALGRLDVDALQADLLHTLPPRAVTVSLGQQQLVCYQRGKAVYRTPVVANTPTGLFHIQAKQSTLPALFWDGRVYRAGIISDWLPISSTAALRAAPWRTTFGLGSSATTGVAPITPGAIDLPSRAAAFLYMWTSVGTEVVVY
jgi:hypothetical protein